jgi:phospholipase C
MRSTSCASRRICARPTTIERVVQGISGTCVKVLTESWRVLWSRVAAIPWRESVLTVSNVALTLAFGAAVLVLSACNGGAGSSPPSATGAFVPQSVHGLDALAGSKAAGKIQHVVIIMQENRSFNNLFMNYPGATTSTYGYDTYNRKIELEPAGLAAPYSVEHDAQGFFKACNGTGKIPGTHCRMNGFNKERTGGCVTGGAPSRKLKHPQYTYVPQKEIEPYWDMAEQYVLADQMYSSALDSASFTSHQYIIAAQAEKSVNTPVAQWGCIGGSGDTIAMIGPQRQVPYGKRVPVCFNDDSIGQEADNAGVSWAFYANVVGGSGGIWSAYQANEYVYHGTDWKNDVLSPNTTFFSDVASGSLRQITWIVPAAQNSDHPGFCTNTGPGWVASLVNAIGESKYWDNTAIFILWDEYGGLYDPEPPAYLDYDGLGMRIPLLIVSAYAKQGYVSHVPYEHGSILKFVEDLFGLPRLAASDKRAKSPEKDAFNFNQPPRTFQAIPSSLGKNYFLRQPPDPRPPDDD